MIRHVQSQTPGIQPAWTSWEAVAYLVCLGLATFSFGLRCCAKRKLNQLPLAEDWCCFISWALAVLEIAVTCKMVEFGLTQPAWLLSPEQHENLHKWIYAVSLIYGPGALFTKLTLLAIMARMFSTHRVVSLSIRLFIAVMIVFYIVLEVTKAVVCYPVSAFWNTRIQEHGYCMSMNTIYVVDTAFVILTDALILVIPIIPAIPLHVPLFQKLKVIGMLGAGGVAVGTTIYREVLIVEYYHTRNYTQDLARIMFYCRLEVTIGQVCACLPFTNFLLQKKPKECVPKRPTKRIRPTASVWFRSIRTQDQRLQSRDSTFTHFYTPKTQPNGYTDSGDDPKGQSSGSQLPFPSKAATTGPAEDGMYEAPHLASRSTFDDGYHHDVEAVPIMLSKAEPLQPQNSGAARMLQMPHEVLVPSRGVKSPPPLHAIEENGTVEK